MTRHFSRGGGVESWLMPMEICENMTNLEHLEKGGQNHTRTDFGLFKPPVKELVPNGVRSRPPSPRQNHVSAPVLCSLFLLVVRGFVIQNTKKKKRWPLKVPQRFYVFGTPYQVARSATAFNPKHRTCVIRGFLFEVCPIR